MKEIRVLFGLFFVLSVSCSSQSEKVNKNTKLIFRNASYNYKLTQDEKVGHFYISGNDNEMLEITDTTKIKYILNRLENLEDKGTFRFTNYNKGYLSIMIYSNDKLLKQTNLIFKMNGDNVYRVGNFDLTAKDDTLTRFLFDHYIQPID